MRKQKIKKLYIILPYFILLCQGLNILFIHHHYCVKKKLRIKETHDSRKRYLLRRDHFRCGLIHSL